MAHRGRRAFQVTDKQFERRRVLELTLQRERNLEAILALVGRQLAIPDEQIKDLYESLVIAVR